MEFNSTEEIIQDIAAGKIVILLDDEDRENEGDLVCAAELIDDKKINFMISKAKGLVCLPLSPQKCDQLNLPMMTNNNRAKHGTGFTVSIEAAEGITTGISAEDRARTIKSFIYNFQLRETKSSIYIWHPIIPSYFIMIKFPSMFFLCCC